MRSLAASVAFASILSCLSLATTGVAVAAVGINLGHIGAGTLSDQIGFRDNDILHQVNGHDVSNWDQFQKALHDAPGVDYIFTVEREGACWFISTTGHIDNDNTHRYSREGLKKAPASACGIVAPPTTAAAPSAPPRASTVPALSDKSTDLYPIPSLGLWMASGNWSQGVPVRKVDPGGPAARAGLVAGDLITSANTARMSNAAMLYRKAEDFSGSQLGILGKRSGKEYFILIDMAGAPSPSTSPSTSPVVASNPPAAESAPEHPAPPLKQPAAEPPQVASPPVSVPTVRVTAPSAISTTVTLVMSVLLVLVLAALAVARRKGWGKGFSLRPASAGGSSFAPTSVADDEEEREIALVRQAVETAERSPDQAPPPAEIGGPSWLQQQRERREVERARRSMEEAERIAARGPTQPPGYYPYPPPPYGYHHPRRPLSEWLRVAYWGIKIALVLTVAIWAWSVTGTVVSMLGAIVPAPLRAATVELLAKAQESISKADTLSQ